MMTMMTMMTEAITAAAVAVAESNSDSGGKPMPLKELFPLHHLHGQPLPLHSRRFGDTPNRLDR
jgi:hypothetical protein